MHIHQSIYNKKNKNIFFNKKSGLSKKMKNYINLFHSMVSEIHFWDKFDRIEKIKKISIFLTDYENIEELLDYFEHFNENLSKKTMNSYLKSVSNA